MLHLSEKEMAHNRMVADAAEADVARRWGGAPRFPMDENGFIESKNDAAWKAWRDYRRDVEAARLDAIKRNGFSIIKMRRETLKEVRV